MVSRNFAIWFHANFSSVFQTISFAQIWNFSLYRAIYFTFGLFTLLLFRAILRFWFHADFQTMRFWFYAMSFRANLRFDQVTICIRTILRSNAKLKYETRIYTRMSLILISDLLLVWIPPHDTLKFRMCRGSISS